MLRALKIGRHFFDRSILHFPMRFLWNLKNEVSFFGAGGRAVKSGRFVIFIVFLKESCYYKNDEAVECVKAQFPGADIYSLGSCPCHDSWVLAYGAHLLMQAARGI